MSKQSPGLLSQDTLELMKKVYAESHGGIDPAKVERELIGFEKEMLACLTELDYEHAVAYLIHLQAYNFLLYLSDRPQLEMPHELLALMPEYANLLKYVAIFYTDAADSVFRVCDDFGLMSMGLDWGDYKAFKKMPELLQEILDGHVSAIIGVHPKKGISIESLVRHGLKNLPNWDNQKAQAFPLPYCTDTQTDDTFLVDFLKALQNCRANQEILADLAVGTLQDREDFNLAAELGNPESQLLRLMDVTRNNLKVAILDDDEDVIDGMRQILQAWPGLSCRTTIVNSEPDVPFAYAASTIEGILSYRADIVLMDEGMGKISGTDYYLRLLDACGGTALILQKTMSIATTTGGGKPNWAMYHITDKDHIAKSRSAAIGFIQMMNRLILERYNATR